jgi:Molecular chaperone, HSP90 family
LEFQAEVRELLNLLIHSLYSNKEIFLRELISNASDAADKLRFEALTDDALYEGDTDLKIRVSYDKKARTLTVADNGIGMTRKEVVENIGTLARSGTQEFLKALTGDQAKDLKLIGQFGVGFYSSFIVADQVVLSTCRAGLGPEHGVRWVSDGTGTYTLETIEKPSRGTEVTLHLRKEEDEFLDGFRLRAIIRKYSDHISLPIVMARERTDLDKDKDKAKDVKETVNRASALWTRSKQEITAQEYNEFYKHIAHDFEDPLAYIHTRVEGTNAYISLFYIPKRAPFDLWDREHPHGVRLYVRRVFILDDAEHLMPRYLRFVRGVVDSEDLPLNISREILQHNKMIDTIRAASVKKLLGLLEDMAKNEPQKYAEFWEAFGRVLKEGPAEDYDNRERIAKLLRFASTHGDSHKQDVSLEDYVARMKPGQEKIYYLTADSFQAVKSSPHREVFRNKDIEVLLLYDRVDEWLCSHLSEFEGKPLQSVARGELNLGKLEDKEARKKRDEAAGELKDVLKRMEKVLGEKVKSVHVSQRLIDSPSCLVVEEHDMTANLQRLLKAAGQSFPQPAPILEINAQHPLVIRLSCEKDENRFKDWTELLFEQAVLAEGGQLDDPGAFVSRLNALLLLQLGSEKPVERSADS